MSFILGNLGLIIPIAIVVIALVVLVAIGYVKAPPNTAFIISGLRKKNRVLIGQSGIRIPFLERMDKLTLELIPIDVKTSSEVPTADYINVRADAAVNIKVDNETEGALEQAAVNFLNLDGGSIGRIAREVLEGNMREIIGQMTLEEMVGDRQKFADKVKENAAPDLAGMGLKIVAFNVQNFEDHNGVIENLGVDNVVRIQKKAAISRAESERDIAKAKSQAAKEANDAKVEAAEQIAEKNAQLERRQAALKKDVDTQKAQADAAQQIEAEKQRQLKDVAATNADIAKAEREADLKRKEIELREYELDALVRKQADADKYAAEKKAEADLIRRQKDAEAKAYEIEQQAKAQKAKADADKYSAEQQAAGIAAVGAAEAEAIEKRAEAQKKMGEASIMEMYFNALPKVVASAAGPLENVDKITMYGEGNSAKLAKDVMMTADQVMQAMSDTTGIDMSQVIASYLGANAASKKSE
jgi:flotillin